MSKLSVRLAVPLVLFMLAGTSSARSQTFNGLSAYFGLGQQKAGEGTTSNSSVACPSGQLFDDFTGLCEPGPTIGGLFGAAGVQYMIKPKIGIGGEYTFHFHEHPYLPNQGTTFRMSFYDLNGIWQPIGTRFLPFLEGGVGGARLALHFNSSNCVTGSCGTFMPVSGFNYFQLHFAAGMKIYVKGNIFVKPEFDTHYVFNLQQFGRNAVIGYLVSAGYTFGKR